MRPDPNVLLRTEPCAECGGMMLWTQNAWAHGNNRAAAYQCPNGHVLDPSLDPPVSAMRRARHLRARIERSRRLRVSPLRHTFTIGG